MATFFSGTYIGYWSSESNHIVGTLTGDVVRSGNTVSLVNMTLSWYTEQTAWGTSPFTFYVHTTPTGGTIGPSGSWSLNSTSFGVAEGQTYAEVGWSSSDGYSGVFGVWFPDGYSEPYGLSASVASAKSDGATINVSISSYGVPSDRSNRYIEASILASTSYGSPYRYEIQYGTTSASLTVDNNTTRGDLVMQPNTRYYYGVYANNGERWASSVVGQFATLAPKATITIISTTPTSVTFQTSLQADGGAYNKYLDYSLDLWATSVNYEHVATSSATSVLYTITGLTPGTSYTLKTRVWTWGTQWTNNDDVGFRTRVPFYGSVNGRTKQVNKLYGSVNGRTKQITKLYGSVNGRTKRIL